MANKQVPGEGVPSVTNEWRCQSCWLFCHCFWCEGGGFLAQTSAQQMLHPEYRQSSAGGVVVTGTCCHDTCVSKYNRNKTQTCGAIISCLRFRVCAGLPARARGTGQWSMPKVSGQRSTISGQWSVNDECPMVTVHPDIQGVSPHWGCLYYNWGILSRNPGQSQAHGTNLCVPCMVLYKPILHVLEGWSETKIAN